MIKYVHMFPLEMKSVAEFYDLTLTDSCYFEWPTKEVFEHQDLQELFPFKLGSLSVISNGHFFLRGV